MAGRSSLRGLAAGKKAQHLKKRKMFEMASGQNGLGFRPQRAHLDCSPAAWRPVAQHVGDYEYMDDGLDDVLLRALRERVVYADTGCHREPPFQDVVVHALAGVEKEYRKNGYRAAPVPTGALTPFRLKEPKIGRPPKKRRGRPPRTSTYPEAMPFQEGKPLSEVVAEMFK